MTINANHGDNNLVPKIIHYCWYGKKQKPTYVNVCMESWQKYFPGFEIKEWNETNTKFDHPFLKSAYDHNYWAFVADYKRIDVLNTWGGIYLDTDMLFIKELPESFLTYDCFLGAEDENMISAGIIGAKSGSKAIKKIYDFYQKLPYTTDFLPIIIPKITTRLLAPNTSFNSVYHKSDFSIFPPEYFYPLPYIDKHKPWERYITPQSICVHLWAGSWLEKPGLSLTKKLKIKSNVIRQKLSQ